MRNSDGKKQNGQGLFQFSLSSLLGFATVVSIVCLILKSLSGAFSDDPVGYALVLAFLAVFSLPSFAAALVFWEALFEMLRKRSRRPPSAIERDEFEDDGQRD